MIIVTNLCVANSQVAVPPIVYIDYNKMVQDIISALKPVATKRFIKKRTILYYQGEVPRSANIMRSGLIKMYSINSSGEEQIVGFQAPGDIFPVPWIFGESSSTLFYYEALTDCELLVMPKESLLELIDKDPALLRSAFNYFVGKHTGLLIRVTALEQTRAIEKILFTLYYLMFHYGKESKPGIFLINLKLTQPVIASMVGLTRETTAKNLNQLKRRGIVSYKEYHYTVNKVELERFLGEDSFKNIELK